MTGSGISGLFHKSGAINPIISRRNSSLAKIGAWPIQFLSAIRPVSGRLDPFLHLHCHGVDEIDGPDDQGVANAIKIKFCLEDL